MDPLPPPRPRPLLPGEPLPWFRAEAIGANPNFVFDTAAGRPMLLLFFGSAADPDAAAALAEVEAARPLFDDVQASFFGITADPADAEEGRVAQQLPGIRFFLDRERRLARLFGVEPPEPGQKERRHWLIVDPMLRAVGAFPIDKGADAIAAFRRVAAAIRAEAPHAPVLVAPRILEGELCRRLLEYYQEHGGEPSGFMREVDGKTRLIEDPAHKMRRDCVVEDAALAAALRGRILTRLVPMVKRAFQFEATRMERYIIGCYAAGEGHFRPHRDNTTKGTAHRRFAVTINLNSDYEGGDLRFPEFGARTYRAPVGGAVVFSCSLLHEATPVTKGTRYAFLPFLYDEAGAKVREANNPHLDPAIGVYKA